MSDEFSISSRFISDLRDQNREELREEVATLYRIRRQQVLRAVIGYTRDPAAAEEITQEAFFRLFQQGLVGRAVENVLSWTLAVARNLARDWARERKHEDVVSTAEWQTLFETHADTCESSERLILNREARDRLVLLVDLLPEPQRNCVRLYGQGFNFREIALSLDLPYHQVILQTKNGLNRIKRLLLRDER